MDFLEQVADKLAIEALEAERITKDQQLITRVKDELGAASTTLEEAFNTAVRVRRAEARGRGLMLQILNQHKASQP